MKVIRTIVLVVVLCLCIMYVWHYYNYPKERQIIQTSLDAFHFDQLLARQPLVVQDRLQGGNGLSEVGHMWFPHNLKRTFTVPSDTWTRTSHKHTMIMNPEEPVEILILHAGGRYASEGTQLVPSHEEVLTAIPLEANQVVILPFHTVFSVNKEKSVILAVHDWVTRLLP